jgi:hypothetical protein
MVIFSARNIFLYTTIVIGLVMPAKVVSQEEYVPELLRRPQRGEAPRYPLDMIIGELGRGSAPEEAWLYARQFLDALIRGSKNAAVLSGLDKDMLNRLFTEIETLKAEKFRLGGGRIEADGTVSFVVRFLSRDKSMMGELYLVSPDEISPRPSLTAESIQTETVETRQIRWRVDNLALEEARELLMEREAYRFDFSPYERFY